MSRRTVTYTYSNGRGPGFWRILFHVTLTFLTGGLWLIWLLVRYLLTR